MLDPISTLKQSGFSHYFCSCSALNRYFQVSDPGPVYLLTNCPLVNLARAFENLQYPGIQYEDAALTVGKVHYIFRCYDEIDPPALYPFTVQELLYDPGQDVYLDPRDIYRSLRQKQLVMAPGAARPLIRLKEAAKLISRYHYEFRASELSMDQTFMEMPDRIQRELLISILAGKHPEKGLTLLYETGFIQTCWPELHKISCIPHMKDYHPEGNAWVHTLETFQYRKNRELTLSLALLLHDIGKPAAGGSQEKPFDGHAELGARIASRFLERIGFARQLIQDVVFLVHYHMMPGALKALPLFRIERVIDSDLFPLLLELYRADLSASYGRLEDYYEACSFYKNYLKHRTNPFRRSDGKKQVCFTHH